MHAFSPVIPRSRTRLVARVPIGKTQTAQPTAWRSASRAHWPRPQCPTDVPPSSPSASRLRTTAQPTAWILDRQTHWPIPPCPPDAAPSPPSAPRRWRGARTRRSRVESGGGRGWGGARRCRGGPSKEFDRRARTALRCDTGVRGHFEGRLPHLRATNGCFGSSSSFGIRPPVTSNILAHRASERHLRRRALRAGQQRLQPCHTQARRR